MSTKNLPNLKFLCFMRKMALSRGGVGTTVHGCPEKQKNTKKGFNLLGKKVIANNHQHNSATMCGLHHDYVWAASRLCVGCITTMCGLHHDYVWAASRLCVGCITTMCGLHHDYVWAASRL